MPTSPPESEKAQAFRSALVELVESRPDIAAKFMEATMTGVLAFVSRWPSCADAFPEIVLDFAVDPIDQAERVSRLREIAMEGAGQVSPPQNAAIA